MRRENRGLFPDRRLSETYFDLEHRKTAGISGKDPLFRSRLKRHPMEYLLFTFPNCKDCDDLKTYVGGKSFEVQEFSLTQKDSKMKIRDYLNVLKRDDKGAIIIPTMIIRDSGEVVSVLNSREEMDSWLRSKA